MMIPHSPSRSLPFKPARLAVVLILAALIAAGLYWWLRSRPPGPLVSVVTLGGTGPRIHSDGLSDPFGIAIDRSGAIFVSDGIGGRVFRLGVDGKTQLVASNLNMPSAIAIASDASLVVANTGDHTIVRIDVEKGTQTIVAGTRGSSGDRDGARLEAQFNGPVGVATGRNGTIVVADTYNDSIRIISTDGVVSTLAGGTEPGFRDGSREQARFDTPCGVVLADDGSIFVADTGNNRIRKISSDGTVSTLAGSGESGSRDGSLMGASFDEPVGIAQRRDGAVFVAESGGSRVRMLSLDETSTTVVTIAGGYPPGLIDGRAGRARLNRPTGLAFAPHDLLVLADSGNGFVRAILPRGKSGIGRNAESEESFLSASEIRETVAPRWPFDPPEARRDIAGTFGEIRGEVLPEHDAWFHSGLDVPGGYGETARAVFSEQVTRPMAVEGAGGPRERLRLPLFGYIHLRIGRDANDRMIPGFDQLGFRLRYDETGQINGLRLRRGARFNAGDALGTLNRMNHVHLVAGPPGAEVNALAALPLPGLTDTMAPVIEEVMVTGENGERLTSERERNGKSRLVVDGLCRIIVRAYDQIDGNAGYRRLAPFRFAYQVLSESGVPARGFEKPRETIVFERLPSESTGVPIAYAEGSQSGYEGKTVFSFIITNLVRDGKAQVGFWNTGDLEPGQYTLRVLVADFFGNTSKRDLPLRIVP